jgi:hypothetical protein
VAGGGHRGAPSAVVQDALRRMVPVAELCAAYGISRKTGYKFLARYDTLGSAGFADQSRRPHCSPAALVPSLPFGSSQALFLAMSAKMKPNIAAPHAAPPPANPTTSTILTSGRMGLRALVLDVHRAGERPAGFPAILQPGPIPHGHQRAHSHAATCSASVNNVFIIYS